MFDFFDAFCLSKVKFNTNVEKQGVTTTIILTTKLNQQLREKKRSQHSVKSTYKLRQVHRNISHPQT